MTKRKVNEVEDLSEDLLDLSTEIKKNIEFDEAKFNNFVKLQNNALIIDSINKENLVRIKDKIHATLNSHPEITELQVNTSTLNDYIIENIGEFLKLNLNINSLQFDSCKIYKHSITTLKYLIESNNSLNNFKSFIGDGRLKNISLYEDSIVKNHFLTNVEFLTYNSHGNDHIHTNGKFIAGHLISNQSLVHKLANSLYNRFNSLKPDLQKLDGGIFYFYQRADKSLLKCYLEETIKTKSLLLIIDNPESSPENKYAAAKSLMNITKIGFNYKRPGCSTRILGSKVPGNEDSDDQFFKEEVGLIISKAESYIESNYFQLRAVFKGPNMTMHFIKDIEVPKFILDHICSYLKKNSLWTGDPKILPGQSITIKDDIIYSIHECGSHYSYSVKQWGIDDSFNLSIPKSGFTETGSDKNSAPVILSLNNNALPHDNAASNDQQTNLGALTTYNADILPTSEEHNQIDEQFNLYESIFKDDDLNLMGLNN